MCCVVFCKFFEGRKYGEIVQECYKNGKELIIDVLLENELIMWYRFRTKEIKICLDSNIDGWKFKLVKDFLEYFKIPLEDYI